MKKITEEDYIELMLDDAVVAGAPLTTVIKIRFLLKEGGAEAVKSHPNSPLWLYWYSHVVGDKHNIKDITTVEDKGRMFALVEGVDRG